MSLPILETTPQYTPLATPSIIGIVLGSLLGFCLLILLPLLWYRHSTRTRSHHPITHFWQRRGTADSSVSTAEGKAGEATPIPQLRTPRAKLQAPQWRHSAASAAGSISAANAAAAAQPPPAARPRPPTTIPRKKAPRWSWGSIKDIASGTGEGRARALSRSALPPDLEAQRNLSEKHDVVPMRYASPPSPVFAIPTPIPIPSPVPSRPRPQADVPRDVTPSPSPMPSPPASPGKLAAVRERLASFGSRRPPTTQSRPPTPTPPAPLNKEIAKPSPGPAPHIPLSNPQLGALRKPVPSRTQSSRSSVSGTSYVTAQAELNASQATLPDRSVEIFDADEPNRSTDMLPASFDALPLRAQLEELQRELEIRKRLPSARDFGESGDDTETQEDTYPRRRSQSLTVNRSRTPLGSITPESMSARRPLAALSEADIRRICGALVERMKVERYADGM